LFYVPHRLRRALMALEPQECPRQVPTGDQPLRPLDIIALLLFFRVPASPPTLLHHLSLLGLHLPGFVPHTAQEGVVDQLPGEVKAGSRRYSFRLVEYQRGQLDEELKEREMSTGVPTYCCHAPLKGDRQAHIICLLRSPV
jgi:hypothetical protein